MSTRDVHAEVPPAQNFHPEFGYLCPSALMRRKVRRASMTMLAGMLIAVGTALALVPQLAPQPPGDGGSEELALSAPASLPADKPAGAADESVPAPMARAAAMTDQRAPSRVQISCDDPSGAFLAPQCQLGRAGKSHMTRAARAASNRAATLPLGRAETSPQGPAAPRASWPSPAAETAPDAVATNEAPTVLPPERPAAPAKKPVKTAHKQAPSRGDIASADTPPAERSPGFDLFGLFHDPSRTGSGAWAMSR
jgi:hypothetical protein